jgi:cation diffusion facilitator family transporter
VHTESVEQWMHEHTFGQDARKTGERRTLLVIAITAVTMGVEIAAGMAFGSMALLADGLHMGSHAAALAVSAFAYFYTRRHAKSLRFNFGTGKVNSLAAFASAVMLVLFAFAMAVKSLQRLFEPVDIGFNHAILVAVLGLVVNGICLYILGGDEQGLGGGHGHGHPHGLEGDDAHHDHHHDHDHGHQHGPQHHHGDARHMDHNLWSAYLHVLADALTSLLAIFALLGGKYLGFIWLDPFMGIVGAVLVVRWSWKLLCASARVLLDMQAPETLREKIRRSIESEGDNRISDLHVWAVGEGIYAAEIALISSAPMETEAYYKLLPKRLGIVHMTVETRQCADRANGDEGHAPLPHV